MTHPPNVCPADLSAAKWVDAPTGRLASFASQSRNWGVVDAAGRMFSARGDQPSVWSTKAVAAQIAAATEFLASGTWIEVAS